jgi:hypothetical protein
LGSSSDRIPSFYCQVFTANGSSAECVTAKLSPAVDAARHSLILFRDGLKLPDIRSLRGFGHVAHLAAQGRKDCFLCRATAPVFLTHRGESRAIAKSRSGTYLRQSAVSLAINHPKAPRHRVMQPGDSVHGASPASNRPKRFCSRNSSCRQTSWAEALAPLRHRLMLGAASTRSSRVPIQKQSQQPGRIA